MDWMGRKTRNERRAGLCCKAREVQGQEGQGGGTGDGTHTFESVGSSAS